MGNSALRNCPFFRWVLGKTALWERTSRWIFGQFPQVWRSGSGEILMESFEKRSILFKIKEGENFNRRNNTRLVFRGLKSEFDAEIGQKGTFSKALYLIGCGTQIIDQRGDVEEDKEDIQDQSRVGIILIAKFLNERNGLEG